MPAKVRVYIETAAKKTFASAADWPGWSRSGKDEASALANLAAYAPRYAKVAKLAKIDFPNEAPNFTVVERQEGDVSTDFGVPHKVAPRDSDPLTPAQAKKLATVVEAAWSVFDGVVAGAPTKLRKGGTRADLTKEAADRFSLITLRLRGRGHPPEAVAHFVNCSKSPSTRAVLVPAGSRSRRS